MVTKKSTKYATRVGAFLLVSIIVYLAVYRAYTSYQGRHWNYNGNFAILDIPELTVTVYVPDRQAIYKFILPKDAYVLVPGGYGTYQIKDVAELSFVETQNGALLARTIATGIGIPVSISSDSLTVWDNIRIAIARNNYTGKSETIDLATKLIFNDELQSDGEEIPVVDPVKVTSLVAEHLWERGIIDEKLTVGVFNASGTPGLATNISHMLETMGIHVIDTTNWEEEPIDETCVFRVLEKTRKTVTLARLTSVLFCKVEYLPQNEGRFDIKLILNELPL
jgi:hypothetical protein